MEVQLAAPERIPGLGASVLSTLVPEKADRGIELQVFLAKLHGAYARPSDAGELIAYSRQHPHVAHAQPLIAVSCVNGRPTMMWCLSDFGHSLFVVPIREGMPILLGEGWLKGCSILMATQ
jgi:hypothetical protein